MITQDIGDNFIIINVIQSGISHGISYEPTSTGVHCSGLPQIALSLLGPIAAKYVPRLISHADLSPGLSEMKAVMYMMMIFTRPGKRLHNELENHHAIHGKTHYFYGHFQ